MGFELPLLENTNGRLPSILLKNSSRVNFGEIRGTQTIGRLAIVAPGSSLKADFSDRGNLAGLIDVFNKIGLKRSVANDQTGR